MKEKDFIPYLDTRNRQSKNTKPPNAGLYIHIPFCHSKCPYCGFYSIVGPELIDDFVSTLLEEIRLFSTQTPIFAKIDSPVFDTIYIGGGTPSRLRIEHLGKILNHFHKYLSLTSYIEITFEINPGDGELSYFQNLAGLGINRLNLGVQSFDDSLLRVLGRRHTADQAHASIHHARQSGFQNLGLDLIYGIPGQDIDLWLKTLEKSLTYTPNHLSCYELTAEENTPFYRQIQKGTHVLPDEETQREFFIRTSESLEAKGYIHYEVSNFALGEKYLSRHNQKYWDHTPYAGFGPSAHSFDGARRWWNRRSIEKYIESVKGGILPVESFEDLTLDQRILEKIYFGMRTRRGIDLKQFQREFQMDLEAEKRETLLLLKKEGLVTIQNGILSPTRAGLAVADRLALI